MSDDLQDLKKKLQLKRREKEEEKPAAAAAPEAGAGPAAPSDDFSLPFQSVDEGPSEQERAILEARAAFERGEIKPHKSGLSAKQIVALVVVLLILFFAGLSFGKVFRMREIENQRIDEALALKAYFETKKVADGSKTVRQAIDDYKAEAEQMMKTLDEARKNGASPEQMKGPITAFLDTSLAFAQNMSYYPDAEVYPVNMVNSEVLALSLPVVTTARELFMAANGLAEQGERIKRLEAPKSATNFSLLIVPTKQTVKATVNPPVGEDGKPQGEPQVSDIEAVRPVVTLIEAGGVEENPLWGTASEAEKKGMERWLVPYKVPGSKDGIQAGKVGEVGAFDASPILQQKDAAYVNGSIGEVAQRIYGLREILQRLAANKKLFDYFDKMAGRDKYFTL